MQRPPIVEHIIRHPESLIYIGFNKEIWMIPDRLLADVRTSPTELKFELAMRVAPYRGKLFVHDGMFYAITSWERTDDRSTDSRTYTVEAIETGVPHDSSEKFPLLRPSDVIEIRPGEIMNYKGGEIIKTTVGRFVANYLLLCYPFGETVDYINEEFSAGKLEGLISKLILSKKISPRVFKDKFVNTLTLHGHTTEMFCPGISAKVITVPDHVKNLLIRLVEENKEALEAGDSSVMSDIEKAVISAYKDYLKGDSSLHFLLKSKYFAVTLKKLFLTHGMVEVFGQPGKFVWVTQAMGSGWKKKDFSVICNETRQGSFSRAVETQFGGVIAKMILRVFQDVIIGLADCGTSHGEPMLGTPALAKEIENSYQILPSGESSLIDASTAKSLVGKKFYLRTPGYCEAEGGYCSRCFGYIYEEHGQRSFATLANDFARNQTTASLKKMHGVSHSTVDVSDLNKFLVAT
jgi:hypothetical protein